MDKSFQTASNRTLYIYVCLLYNHRWVYRHNKEGSIVHMESKLEAIVKILNLIAKENDEYSDVLSMLANELDGIAYEMVKSDNRE